MAAILLFDGVCNLCNYWVQFAIKNSNKNTVYFASLQSDIGAKLLLNAGLSASYSQSLVLVQNGKIYTHSSAVLRLCAQMNWYLRILVVLVIIPSPIRNAFYNFFAKNRYAWWGKLNVCMLPTPEIKHRFIETEMDLNRIGMEI